MPILHWTFLGRVPYRQALQIQIEHARAVAAGAPPCLFLMEHPPTVTIGRQGRETSLRLTPGQFRARRIEVVQVMRGGDVTYHGPGQLVGYPVASLDDLGCSVPAWVQGCAASLVAILEELGITSRWSDRHPGVWVGNEKIAALGFHLARRISTHGFALNLDTDLAGFEAIVPCGIADRGVTSVKKVLGRSPSLSEVAPRVAASLAETFHRELVNGLPAAGQLRELRYGVGVAATA